MASEEALARMPKSVRVGPVTYGVTTDGDGAYDYGFWGMCKNRSCRIAVDPLQPDTSLPLTLTHEVLHAIGAIFEIPMVREHTVDTSQVVTDRIHGLATALVAFIRANPEFLAWLREEA